jgi:hypothetical protein
VLPPFLLLLSLSVSALPHTLSPSTRQGKTRSESHSTTSGTTTVCSTRARESHTDRHTMRLATIRLVCVEHRHGEAGPVLAVSHAPSARTHNHEKSSKSRDLFTSCECSVVRTVTASRAAHQHSPRPSNSLISTQSPLHRESRAGSRRCRPPTSPRSLFCVRSHSDSIRLENRSQDRVTSVQHDHARETARAREWRCLR